MKSIKRSPRITSDQMALLLLEVEHNFKELYSGKSCMYTRAVWKTICEKLNALGPPIKSIPDWKRTLADLKLRTRKKHLRMLKDSSHNLLDISDAEEHILRLWPINPNGEAIHTQKRVIQKLPVLPVLNNNDPVALLKSIMKSLTAKEENDKVILKNQNILMTKMVEIEKKFDFITNLHKEANNEFLYTLKDERNVWSSQLANIRVQSDNLCQHLLSDDPPHQKLKRKHEIESEEEQNVQDCVTKTMKVVHDEAMEETKKEVTKARSRSKSICEISPPTRKSYRAPSNRYLPPLPVDADGMHVFFPLNTNKKYNVFKERLQNDKFFTHMECYLRRIGNSVKIQDALPKLISDGLLSTLNIDVSRNHRTFLNSKFIKLLIKSWPNKNTKEVISQHIDRAVPRCSQR